MYQVETPDKQAPAPQPSGSTTAKQGQDGTRQKPHPGQIFHDWAAI